MKPFDAYRMFQAMKLHYTSPTYSYRKYNGRTRVSIDSFEKRSDKYFYSKLSKHEEPFWFMVIALFHRPTTWIGNLLSDENEEMYRKHKGVLTALEYTFKTDMARYDSLDDAFLLRSEYGYPTIYQHYREKKVHAETIVICNRILTLFPYWNTIITDIVIWPRDQYLISKYGEFIDIDLHKYNDIMRQVDNQIYS